MQGSSVRSVAMVVALFGSAAAADADDGALTADIRNLADFVDVAASVIGVLQQANPAGGESGARESRANYRGDVAVSLPGGSIGDVEGKIFAHFRFGQGSGVRLRPTFTSTPNT